MMQSKVTFKPSTSSQEEFVAPYSPLQTIEEYKRLLADHYSVDPYEIKLIFKGRILLDHETGSSANIANAVVILVCNSPKKIVKKALSSQEQTIPGAGMNTGLGGTSPFGFGNYGMVNHPQYMSAISSAVDPQKMQEMMEDPQTQGMLQEIMKDPDTMRQLMEDNPMTKGLMDKNPFLKQIMANPALLKTFFNEETIKKSMEFMQKSGISGEDIMQSMSQPNPTIMGNPIMGNPIMGNPIMGNPIMGNPMMNFGGFPQMNYFHQIPQMPMQDELRYASQLKQLESMGFNDRAKNIRTLKETDGDLDRAIEKMCSD